MFLEKRLVVAKGERAGRRMEWEVGVSRCKFLYIEWILHSTKNYIQYPMINHNRKGYEKKNIIYVLLNHFAVQQ